MVDPQGKCVATLKTVTVPAHRQAFTVGPGQIGIWKVVVAPAATGAFDDAYLEPGPELDGCFSLSGDQVLRVERARKK